MNDKESKYQLFSDTDPAAEAVLIGLLRKKQPAEKLRMVNQLNASVRVLTLSGLRQRHPDANQLEIKLRLAQLLLGTDLAAAITPALKQRWEHKAMTEKC